MSYIYISQYKQLKFMKSFKISAKITNRDTEALKEYLRCVSLIDMLTPEEELELATKSIKGDEDAINELVSRNLRFVISVAKHYKSSSTPLLDLINEGNIGLIKAAHKFDPENTKGKNGKNMKFISYAVWWVRKTILEYLATNGRMVRLPHNKLSDLSKLDKKISDLEQRECRNIDIQEVIQELGDDSSRDKLELLDVLGTYSMDSLDREIGGDEGKTTLGELMADNTFESTDHLVNEYDVKNEVDRMLNTLDAKSKRVIIAMYGLDGTLPMTLAEVGVEFGVTRETIRQIKEKTLTKLKAKLDNSTLKSIFQG